MMRHDRQSAGACCGGDVAWRSGGVGDVCWGVFEFAMRVGLQLLTRRYLVGAGPSEISTLI